MIDKEVFVQGMGQLGGAFGREIDGPVSKMYYGILSPKLSTEQWVEAVTKTMTAERFWPSPAVILSYAVGDPEMIAGRALAHVRGVIARHGGVPYLPASAVEFDAPTWAGIKEIGGLAHCSTEKNERRFVRAYLAALTPQPVLSASAERPQPETRRLVASVTRSIGRDRAVPKGDAA
jgi:hypothetical protein